MDMDNYLRFVLALAFVLGLIGVLAMLVRKYGPGRMVAARRGPNRRLWVSEVLPLDGRRRLVLVRRDGVEHLMLLGHGADLIVEAGIQAPTEDGDSPPADNPDGGRNGRFKAAMRSIGGSQ